MLDVCREYAEAHDNIILFNAIKTNCMFLKSKTHSILFDKDVQFMGSPICLVDKCNLIDF